MAKKDAQTVFEISDGAIRAGFGGQSVLLPASRQPGEDGEPVLVVELDMIDAWDNGPEISMKDLQRLLELIERECEARDIEVEFE
jgi:hypothetical protein